MATARSTLTRRACGALLASGLMACVSGPRSVDPAREPLLIACDFENPPFASLDAEGQPVGHDVELGVELARRLGRPLVWTRTRFEEILPSIERGEADLAIATIGYTAERDVRVDFSAPYFRTGIAVLVRTGEGEPRGIEELHGRRLTAGIGTTSEFAVRARGLEAELGDKAPVRRSAQERLLAGEVDACVMDAPDAHDLVALHPERLVVLDELLETEDYCIAVRPDDPELRVAVDGILAALEAEGFLERLDQEWGLRAGIHADQVLDRE